MSVARKYFDLNDRAEKGKKDNGTVILQGTPEVLSSETGCHLEWNSPVVQSTENPSCMSLTRQILMYVGVFVGVLFSTVVSHFRSGEEITLAMTIGEVVAAAIIALVIIPLVYEKLQLYPKAPFIVQFGLFVQNGVFWHVLIELVLEGVF
ncbi:MAG: hypothetical protein AYK19_03610 [Theionarchaea archaeon DG-70-1]|nr:MAG: hypothetical protein AYK19_03610 [Theionarchaea archaeon DG-70-1]